MADKEKFVKLAYVSLVSGEWSRKYARGKSTRKQNMDAHHSRPLSQRLPLGKGRSKLIAGYFTRLLRQDNPPVVPAVLKVREAAAHKGQSVQEATTVLGFGGLEAPRARAPQAILSQSFPNSSKP